MAQRWTLALILICLSALITAFRVRDLPKSIQDSVKKQEKCENCDVKFGSKWHSGIIESDKYTNEENKKALREKQTSNIIKTEVKSSNDDEQTEDDNEDFSFLKFKSGFIQEYQKEALNKLEEKLEIITKSFWNLFGDEGSDVEVDEENDDDIDDDDDFDDSVDDDYEYDDDDDDDRRLKVLNLIKKSKIFKQKKKTESNTNSIINEPKKQPVVKVKYDNDGDNKMKIKSHVENKFKFQDLKHKTEVPKSSINRYKFRSSYTSEEDSSEDDNTNNVYTDKKTDDEESELIFKDFTKKSSSTVTEKSLPIEKTPVNSKNKDHNVENIINKISENLSKRYKTIESTAKKSNKNLLKDDGIVEGYNNNEDDDDDDDNDADNIDNREDDSDEEEKHEKRDENDDDDDDEKVKDDSTNDYNFLIKRTDNIQGIFKYKDTKENNFRVKQSSEEMKDKNTLHQISREDDTRLEDDSTKNRTKSLSKTQSDKTFIHEKGSDVIDVPSKIVIKNERYDDSRQLHNIVDHKNLQATKSKITKREVINKETIHNKTTEQDIHTTGFQNKQQISSTNHQKQSIVKESEKLENKDKEKTQKDFQLANKLDKYNEIKLLQDSKDTIKEPIKMTKDNALPKQTTKEDEIDDDLKNLQNKAKDYKARQKMSAEQLSESQETYSKGDSNLKHITDALHRRSLLKSEFEDFYTFLPTFAPNFSRVHNPECRRHGQIMLRQLRGSKLWALNMLDATAKIPSGLLQGNGIQLGDFEQCLASRARVQLDTGSVVKVQGKYCLAFIDVKAEHSALETPVHLALAKNLIKSRIDDPGHFVPRFSTLSWGVCVPSPCQPEDVEVILRDAIRHYQRTTGVVVRIKVNEQDCQIEKGADRWEKWLELPTVLTLSFYGVIIMLVCVATVQDHISRRDDEVLKKNETGDKAECDQKETKTKADEMKDVLSIFSLYHTMKKLTAPGTTDDISCIHGVRAVATVALLVAHKFLPVAVMPYNNRLKITEMVSSAVWSWCRAGWIFTDCFLLLSGTLSAYRLCTDNSTGAPKRLLFRYLRLTPALSAVVFFYAYIWDNISTGPMWGTFVTRNARVCQEGWWWNLIYLQNYFGFEDMCAPQTHQLALDMQLTIVGGIIVWLAQEKSAFTKLALPAIHILAAYSRYSTVRDHRLTMLAYYGVSVSQLYRTAHLSYTSVLHRSTSYLVGISLGIALQKPSKHGKFFFTVGWIASGIMWSLVWWAGYDSGYTHYRYNVTTAAQYAAFTPIASALSIAWVIYAVHSGCSDLLKRLFCFRPLVLISRLSYAIYLCQFIIFITNIGTVKASSKFTITTLFDIGELLAIILLSTVITLTLVIPMQSLPKFLFPPKIEIVDVTTLKMDSKMKNKPNKDLKGAVKEEKEVQKVKQIQKILVHREVLKEIPEVGIEFESQRDSLEGILEEEENEEDLGEEEEFRNNLDDDLVIIEEHGDEESWSDRENEQGSYSRDEDNELDEWEWTTNGRNGAQYIRYSR